MKNNQNKILKAIKSPRAKKALGDSFVEEGPTQDNSLLGQYFDKAFDFDARVQNRLPQEETNNQRSSSPSSASMQGSFRDKIAAKESGGDYSAMSNVSSATGKYQFIWNIHKDYISKLTGIKSQSEFVKSPEAQEAYMDYWDSKTLTPTAQKLSKNYPGYSMDQLKALVHFQGASGAEKALKQGLNTVADANNYTSDKYVQGFEKGGVVPDDTIYDSGDLESVDIVGKKPHKPDSLEENIIEIFDPTGISNWDDYYRSVEEHGFNSSESWSEAVGLIPFLKLGKLAKGIGKGIVNTYRKGGKNVNRALISGVSAGAASTPIVNEKKEDIELVIEQLGERFKNTSEKQLQTGFHQPKYKDGGVVDFLGKNGSGILSLVNSGMGFADALSSFGGQTSEPYMSHEVASKQLQPRTFKNGGTVNSNNMYKFKMGGLVPIEAEGGEAMQDPMGNNFAIEGPQHSEGGVPLDVPPGTKIFSDKIAVDGRTMSDRKKKRERLADKISKSLDRNKSDKILSGTLDRVRQRNALADMKDLAIQETVKGIDEAQTIGDLGGNAPPESMGEEQMFEGGTGIDGVNSFGFNPQFGPMTNAWYSNEGLPSAVEFGDFNSYLPSPHTVGADPNLPKLQDPNYVIPAKPTVITIDETKKKQEKQTGISPVDTFGNLIGVAGTIGGGMANLANTRKMMEESLPNQNFYQGFGQDALETMSRTGDYLNETLRLGLEDSAIQRNTAFNSVNNAATSVNNQRALNLGVDNNARQSNNKLYNAIAQTRSELDSRRAQMELSVDEQRRKGAYYADDANRRDMGAGRTALSKNIIDMADDIKGLAKTFNIRRQQLDSLGLIAAQSVNGIETYRDFRTGKLYQYKNNKLTEVTE